MDKYPVKRGRWKTRIGFYLVAMGSSFGLGNLWRFPYVVGENGGGAFVLLYIFVAMVLGMPMIIGELVLGRHMGQGVLVASSRLAGRIGAISPWIGRLSLILSIVVLSYYSVISGWVLHFMVQYLRALVTNDLSATGNSFNLLASQGVLQLLLASVHILLCIICVAKGVQEGLEKWISYAMPLFAVMVIFLVYQSLSLPTVGEVFRFLFYPDFSKLSMASFNQAISHVLFTLSLGFGTMVTYGSYMDDSVNIAQTGFRVTLMDTMTSLIALLLLFPVVFQVSDVPMTDPAMLFEALPQFMLYIRGGHWFGMVFFLCLYLAALNASIGLLEGIVSNIVDAGKVTGEKILMGIKLGRNNATWLAGLIAFCLSSLPALFAMETKGGETSFIEKLDKISINWILPWAALGIVLLTFKGIDRKTLEKNFDEEDVAFSGVSLFAHWKFVIKWLVPIFIVSGFLLQVMSIFNNH